MRRLLVLALAAAALAALAWSLLESPSEMRPTGPTGDAAAPSPPDPATANAPLPAVVDAAFGGAQRADGARPGADSPTRRAVGGVGRFEGRLAAGGQPMAPDHWQLSLANETDPDGPGIPLDWVESDAGWLVVGEAPDGAYRVRIDHGPGDPLGIDRSVRWDVRDPLGVDIHNGALTNSLVRAAQRDGAPPPGRARVLGTARLDGAPAAGMIVHLEPLASGKLAVVARDGTFALRDVPTGRRNLSLLSRGLKGRRGNSYALRYAVASIAPSDGGQIVVHLEGTSAVLEGTVLAPDGTPSAARVAVTGRFLTRIGGLPIPEEVEVDTAADGTFAIPGLPLGPYQVGAETSHARSAPRTIEVSGDGSNAPVHLQLVATVLVRGRVSVPGRPESRRGGTTLTLWLRGPEKQQALVKKGAFSTELMPGRYEVTFRGWDRKWYRHRTPIVVGPDGLDDLLLDPVRTEPPRDEPRTPRTRWPPK